MTNPNLWGAAKAIAQEHGLGGGRFAMLRADELLNRGDLAAAAEWRGVFRRVHQLLSLENETKH